LLAIDPEFANRVRSKQRTKLLSDPIATPEMEQRISAELRDAIARVAKEPMHLPAGTDDRAFFLFCMRLLMADIVRRGLAPPQHRQTLTEATLFLREAWDHCEAARRKTWGARRASGKTRGQGDRARERWVHAMAREWRERKPDAPQSSGIQWLHAQAAKKSNDIRPWPTREALRLWLNRKGIRI
jgi:hypothetical protein